MLVVRGWQVYVWRDGDSATLIDTGAPGSGDEILAAVPQIDRIVLTHGHVDHCGSAAELQDATGATVFAGAGDATKIRKRPASATVNRSSRPPIPASATPLPH
nr:MBL fold metallo-hydrolase [Mycolicibacterium gadium]